MQTRAPLQVSSLVATALGQEKLSGLSKMLMSIADITNACACILWRVSPTNRDTHNEHLFVLAEWIRGDDLRCVLHKLPINESKTGEAVLTQKSVNVVSVEKNPDIYKKDHFLLKAKIKTFCSVPITFLDDCKGALNLYKNVAEPFSENEIVQIELLASLVPALYQAIADKVSLGLTQSVNAILQKADLRSSHEPMRKDDIKNDVIQEICNVVSETFQCIETSIFLEDHLETPGDYELMATTWPGPLKRYLYHQDVGEGLTGWVLSKTEPVAIFDLAYFEKDKEEIRRIYPGITWMDPFDIKSAVRKICNLGPDEELQPLSYIATPIVMGDKVRGVIRCSVAYEGPYYFAELALKLLQLVAAQISRYWSIWLSRRAMQNQIHSWKALVESLGELNNFVYRELTQQVPHERRIFTEALRLTNDVIPEAEIADVRLLDGKGQHLYFAETWGKYWKDEHKRRTFSLSETSAGVHVLNTGEVYVVQDVKTDPYYSGTFSDIKCMIIAPIQIEGKIYGVLDIRGTGPDFPPHVKIMADLLGRQLGLYRYLANTIATLRKTELDLKSSVKEQTQTYEDLEHQLRTPINQAFTRAEGIVRRMRPRSDDEAPDTKLLLQDTTFVNNLFYQLCAIRGLCRKAQRTTVSMRLFAELASRGEISLKSKRLRFDDLVKALIEAAKDHELTFNPSRQIKFIVDRETFTVLASREVTIDFDLILQAINNVLDNAGKYSFGPSTVRIKGGLTRKKHFHITVINWGLPIRSEEVSECIKRGYRGGRAELVTGDGSGIGLWLVDKIISAHDGSLEIVPTTLDGKTEVKLILPTTINQ